MHENDLYERMLEKRLVLFTGPDCREKTDLAWRFYRTVRGVLPVVAFPAERVATHLLANVPPSSRGSYPTEISDISSISSDLLTASGFQGNYADLATEIEQMILGGSIGVHGQLSFSSKILVEIRDAGTAAKSLGGLVFYLRHLAQKGEFVVIDEPELGLHPVGQRQIARILVKAVNRGLWVLAGTHSDYLIRELNHLILLSRPGDAMAQVRERLGCDPESLLAPEQLGVYFFDDTGNRELPVDERGFEDPTIEAAIDDMNADSQAIYAALLED